MLSYSQERPEDIVEKFFADFAESGSDVALDNLYATNAWISRNMDAISNLKDQLRGMNEELVGDYFGYELISEVRFSDSFLAQSYMVKFDRQPIRFIFQLYKPNDRWKIYGFEYDGNFADELAERIKLPREDGK